jgi:hypothetical protein
VQFWQLKFKSQPMALDHALARLQGVASNLRKSNWDTGQNFGKKGTCDEVKRNTEPAKVEIKLDFED